ncbi:MAG TPA: globin domain-containing protein [Candidatus Acidoferrum sp.]|nr:globin domain-containing protein [Candidatus Acidoferrum sp.]
MLTKAEKVSIRRSWDLVKPIMETVADLFYRRLFEIAPQYRSLFKQDMEPQKRKLIAMLSFIVESLDWPDESWKDSIAVEDDLFLVVLALGRRHIRLYRVTDEAYEAVGDALLWTFDYGLGEAFTRDIRDAWSKAYWIISRIMQMGRLAAGEASQLQWAMQHE